MSQLTRWGFDRKTGRKLRPDLLVRSAMAPVSSAMGPVKAFPDIVGGPGLFNRLDIIASSQGRAAAARSVHVRKVAGSSPAPATKIHAKARDEAPAPRLKRAGVERVSRAAAGRSAAATSEIMDVTAGETALLSKAAHVVPAAQAVPPERVTVLPPATAPVDPVKPRPRAPRINLSTAPSGMERLYEGTPLERITIPCLRQGTAYCRCNPEGLVPDWFGRDCIEPHCGLKGSNS